ncbi:hypothetical protein [Gordonia malaquae]|uniref:hypothetical protein n=1 Tax=Gordonia malaquae TaxID=410332 RepID=UPI0030FE9B7D
MPLTQATACVSLAKTSVALRITLGDVEVAAGDIDIPISVGTIAGNKLNLDVDICTPLAAALRETADQLAKDE